MLAPGEAAAGGRWWIRECYAVPSGDTIALHLGGPGWSWVDDGAWGFDLTRYVYFDVRTDVAGRLDAGYDSRSHIATVWFSPVAIPRVLAGGLGNVETSVNFGGAVAAVVTLGIYSLVGGAIADDVTRDKITKEVSDRFAERMKDGFTATYDIVRRQLDFIPQPLSVGQTPSRPFKDGKPWLANERQILRRAAGGYHVIGPFERGSVAVDLVVESGMGVEYQAGCEAEVAYWFSPVATGTFPQLPKSANSQEGAVNIGAPSTRFISMPSCRWFLITSSLGDETRVLVRVRGSP